MTRDVDTVSAVVLLTILLVLAFVGSVALQALRAFGVGSAFVVVFLALLFGVEFISGALDRPWWRTQLRWVVLVGAVGYVFFVLTWALSGVPRI